MKKKLTIVKVCGTDYLPSSEDVKHWADLFDGKLEQIREAKNLDKYNILASTTHLEKHTIEYETGSKIEKIITFIKLGGHQETFRLGNVTFSPSEEDLNAWRDIFAEAKDDTNFEIFTHFDVKIEQIRFDDIIAIE